MKIDLFPRLLLVISLGFLLFLSSCKSRQVLTGFTKPVFFDNIIEIPKSSIPLKISIPYDSILKRLNYSKGRLIIDIKEDSGKDPLTIEMLNAPELSFINGRFEINNCKIRFKSRPSISGINAGWLEGMLNVTIKLPIQTPFSQEIKFTSCEFKYDWVEKPKVKMLGMGVNVSPILDKYIQSNEQKIKELFLVEINSKIASSNWLPTLKNSFLNIEKGAFQILSKQIEMQITSIDPHKNFISLNMKAEGLLGLKLKGNKPIRFNQIGTEGNLLLLYADKNSIKEMIEKLLMHKNNQFKNTQFELKYLSKEGINIETIGLFGKKSIISFDCQLYSNDSTLKFSSSNIQLHKLKFPFQFIKSPLRRKINKNIAQVSIDIPSMVNGINTIPGLNDLQFKEIRMNSDGILLIGKFIKPILEIYP